MNINQEEPLDRLTASAASRAAATSLPVRGENRFTTRIKHISRICELRKIWYRLFHPLQKPREQLVSSSTADMDNNLSTSVF